MLRQWSLVLFQMSELLVRERCRRSAFENKLIQINFRIRKINNRCREAYACSLALATRFRSSPTTELQSKKKNHS